MTKTTTTNI